MAYILKKLQEMDTLNHNKILCLQQANEMKVKGNDLFQEKDYKGAIATYHQALMKLRAADPPFGEKRMDKNHDSTSQSAEAVTFYQDCNKLKILLHLNLAACLIEIPNRPPDYYAKAVKYCDVVLESEPNNLKALYRKSIGLYLAQNYHPALSLLRVVDKRLNGRDVKVREYLTISEVKVKEKEQQLKERMSRAFGDDQNAASTSSVSANNNNSSNAVSSVATPCTSAEVMQ